MTDRMTPEREAEIRKIRNCVPFIEPNAGVSETQSAIDDLLAELDAVRAELAALERKRDEARASVKWGEARWTKQYDVLKQVYDRTSRYGDCANETLNNLVGPHVRLIGVAGPPSGDRIAALESRNAALVEAVEAATKLCRCRGTGFYATDCTLCGDSTYDHICNDRRVACTRTECVSARAALARAEAAVKGDKE